MSGGTQFLPGTSTGLDHNLSDHSILSYTQTLTSVVGKILPGASTGLNKTVEVTLKTLTILIEMKLIDMTEANKLLRFGRSRSVNLLVMPEGI